MDVRRERYQTHIDTSSLVPGDILLKRPSEITTFPQSLIMLLQRPVPQDGHHDTTHVAIFIRHDHDGMPIVAHIDGSGYHLQRLDQYDTMTRAYFVARYDNKKLADAIADIASREEVYKGMTYAKCVAFGAMFTCAKIARRNKLSKKSKTNAWRKHLLCVCDARDQSRGDKNNQPRTSSRS